MKHLAMALALALTAGASQAAVIPWSADLAPENEVPPATAPGASGSGVGTIDTDTKLLTWSVDWIGLTGSATAAHFHLAPAGANGGVVINIFTTADDGSETLTDELMVSLLAGNFYINVHTVENPGGEIRGQVVPGAVIAPVPVPATLPLLLSAGTILGLMRRRSICELRPDPHPRRRPATRRRP